MYVYASLMKGYTRNRDLKGAIKLYDKVKENKEVIINIFFYNSFLGYFISYKNLYRFLVQNFQNPSNPASNLLLNDS